MLIQWLFWSIWMDLFADRHGFLLLVCRCLLSGSKLHKQQAKKVTASTSTVRQQCQWEILCASVHVPETATNLDYVLWLCARTWDSYRSGVCSVTYQRQLQIWIVFCDSVYIPESATGLLYVWWLSEQRETGSLACLQTQSFLSLLAVTVMAAANQNGFGAYDSRRFYPGTSIPIPVPIPVNANNNNYLTGSTTTPVNYNTIGVPIPPPLVTPTVTPGIATPGFNPVPLVPTGPQVSAVGSTWGNTTFISIVIIH